MNETRKLSPWLTFEHTRILPYVSTNTSGVVQPSQQLLGFGRLVAQVPLTCRARGFYATSIAE